MHKPHRRSAFWVSCAAACLASSLASAQTPAAESGTPAAPATEPAPPTAAPEATPPQAPAPPAQQPPAAAPPEPAPHPQYGTLGGTPESEVQEGAWNPWDHPDTTGSYLHEGFFLRLQLGPGYSSVARHDEDWDGFALGMGLALGYNPVEDFAIHLDFQTTWMFDPSNEVDGIGMQALGLGVTWYLMPIGIFLSGSAGVGWLAFENDEGQSKDSSAGFAFDAEVGKEWWAGADWGIGAGVQFLYMNVEDYVDDASLHAFAINAVFTATYN